MKKVLLATTMLVATAGMASADLSLTGSANMGFKYNDSVAGEPHAWYELDFGVAGSGETDSGLGFGAEIDLDQDTNGSNIGGTTAHVSGGFGKVTIGNVDPAIDDRGLGDIGFDGIGIDDAAETGYYTGTADVRYDGEFGPVGVVASLDSNTDSYGLGASFDAGQFSVGVAYDHDATTANGDAIAVNLGAEFGAIAADLFFTDYDGNAQGTGLKLDYTTGAMTLSLAAADHDSVPDTAVGVGVSYDLGGGAAFAGGVGTDGAGDSVADLGITMKF